MYEELAAAVLCTHWTGGKRIRSGELQGFAMQQLLQSPSMAQCKKAVEGCWYMKQLRHHAVAVVVGAP